jgi:phosphotriesterase-related protein
VTSGRVVTVGGDVEPAEIGWTLPHEHTTISLWHVPDRWDYWELTRNIDVVVPELAAFRDLGGSCIVDVTAESVGRDPSWLRDVSEATGLHVVMGCGWYRGPYYPPTADIERRSVDSLADELVREFELGVGETGIRPGIIGEIGTDKPWLSPAEERVHRAVARAARRTGMAVTTHAVLSPVGLAQLKVFEEEGLDPSRVVIGHADSWPHLDHYLEIVGRGASVEFDFLGMSFTPQERVDEPRTIELLMELVSRGHADRVLLSQDVCHNQQLKHYGGNGYTYLADALLPRLREAGLSESDIATISVLNPRRLLTIAPTA